MTTTSLLGTGSRHLRGVLAVAAGVAAVAHVPVIGSHLNEAPYMGLLFLVLTGACIVLAAGAVIRGGRAVYLLTVLTCGLAVLGYAATRLVAFPMLGDDVGNWLEPLGVVSIVSESIAVAAALVLLTRRPPGPQVPSWSFPGNRAPGPNRANRLNGRHSFRG